MKDKSSPYWFYVLCPQCGGRLGVKTSAMLVGDGGRAVSRRQFSCPNCRYVVRVGNAMAYGLVEESG